MTQRYLTHFSTMVILHFAILFGGLKLIHDETTSSALGSRILNLKMVGEVLLQTPKKPELSRVMNPALPKTSQTEIKPGALPEVATSSLSGTALSDAKSLFKSELRNRIEENRSYPAAARRLGQTGTVVVAFTMLDDGSIIDVRIDSSSGNARLDSAGLEAVKKVGKFKPIPGEFGERKLDLAVPIKFNII